MALLTVLMVLLAGCQIWTPSNAAAPIAAQPSDTTPVATTPTASPTPSPTPQQPETFTLLAAGDVLPHTAVREAAIEAGGGTIDYNPLTAAVQPWISGADLAICHMEVPVIRDGEKPSSYPVFGVEDTLVADLAQDGWDGCSTASNHSIDRGYADLAHTLDTFDQQGMGHAGTARSEAESDVPQLYQLTRAGRTVTIAHISMAFGTNGLPLPQGKAWSVSLIDTDRAIAMAKQARADGADVVVVSIHAGTEYQTAPTDFQREVAQRLADSGEVDLYIGHHAHVPQPIELLPGGVGGRGMWTFFGLGNFISNQDSHCCTAKTDSGVFLLATFTVPPGDGPVELTDVHWAATTVDRLGGERVYPIEQVLHTGVGTLTPADLQARLDRVRMAVGTQAAEQTTPPVPTGDPAVVVPHVR